MGRSSKTPHLSMDKSGIRHAAGFIQRKVASALDLRHCPEIHFDIDETAKKVRQMMNLLDLNRRNEPAIFEQVESETEGMESASNGPIKQDVAPLDADVLLDWANTV